MRITQQGFPHAIVLSGMFLVTTLPAPITTFSPIVTPGKIMVPPPIHELSLMDTGKALVFTVECVLSKRILPLRGCVDV